MILDILAYLKADSTLDGLLGASASNSKIYPNQKPHSAVEPYIIYRLERDGTTEENLLEASLIIECVSTEYLTTKALRDQIVLLLDLQDKIRTAIPSTSHYFYWCKNVDGDDVKEPVQDYFHKTVVFNLKYAQK